MRREAQAEPLFGGVEAGGTTFRCAVGPHPLRPAETVTIPTRGPEATLREVAAFFAGQPPVQCVGIASFGPVGLGENADQYGRLLETPKVAWQGFPILGFLQDAIGRPCVIDTDVTAAALAEHRYGAGKGQDALVYVTVGTGVGAAYLVDGRPPPARFHAEMGHCLIPHDRQADSFTGMCPFHGDCLEGLASATAVAARWRAAPEELPDDHPAWALEASYLAAFCVNLVRVLAPRRILLGGGLLQRPSLLELTRTAFRQGMGGYHDVPAREVQTLIAAPALAPDAGLIGALLLAHSRLQRKGGPRSVSPASPTAPAGRRRGWSSPTRCRTTQAP